MPYDPSDPRAQLSTAGGSVNRVPRAATYRELHESAADEVDSNGSRSWWTRSQALVVSYTESQAGDDLVVEGASGEYVALLLEGAVSVDHASGSAEVDEPAVVVIPPGHSTIRIVADGLIVRLFASSTVPALVARCANADDYADGDPNVADFVTWPEPSGQQIRVYRLADLSLEEGRLGRILRCSTVMVNVLPDDDTPRDPTKLSPHHHDDFEQVSLQVCGDYVHHMRVPWTPDSTTWRDDEHRHCSAPAVVVIPPPLIHTSQSVGAMPHWLIDVFAPPRFDFSQRPGWVLNAGDYPMPAI